MRMRILTSLITAMALVTRGLGTVEKTRVIRPQKTRGTGKKVKAIKGERAKSQKSRANRRKRKAR